MKRLLVVAVVLVLAVMLAGSPMEKLSAAAQAPCAQGDMTITATFPNDAGFENLWKYTVTGSWDTGAMSNALSHISFLFALDCPCACEIAHLIQFDDPAGTATGTDSLNAPCTVDFIGLYECDGDPTIPSNLPAIKFEAPDNQDCETGQTGTGTWCFYTFLAPRPDTTYTDAVVVKFGNSECTGDLTGALPDCSDCTVIPVEDRSWGAVKSDYDH